MAYAFVKNVLNIPEEDGTIKEFIKITTLAEFNLYEFLMKVQLLKNENFYQINTCFDLNDILNSNIEQLNADLISLISKYSFLGDISFNIETDIINGSININLDIYLNESIHDGLNKISTNVNVYINRNNQ